jgi:hypothetical protein
MSKTARSGRRRRPRPAESKEPDNTILYIVGGIAGAAAIVGGIGVAATLWERYKKSNDEEAQPTKQLESKSLQERIEKACTEILTKQLKEDTPETTKLRALCDEINMDAEDIDSRLSLARFVRWRTGYIEGVDLAVEHRIVTSLLNFPLDGQDDVTVGNWLRTKFDIAFASKNLVEISRVQKIIKKLTAPAQISEIGHTMYYQISFKLACIYGDWDSVTHFGEKVAELNSVVNNPITGRRESIPLLHTYQTQAQKDPEKNPNWYIMFFRRKMFKTRFQVLYQSQLQFLHWNIVSGRTKYANGQTSIQKLQESLDAKKGESWKNLNMQHQDLWIYGSMCQMRMKTIEEGKCILTGPWNDAEMCLVGLMFYMVKQKPMRIEVTLQLERGEWLPKVAGRNKGAWQWSGQLIFERFLQAGGGVTQDGYQMLSQEVHDIEIVLDDH